MNASTLGNTVCAQLGILCHDIEKTAKAWADFLGLDGYEVVLSSPPEVAHTVYQDKATQARCKQAFFMLGEQLQLELIEPDEHESTWRESLEAHGEGLHHIAFWVKGTDTLIAKLDAASMRTQQTGAWPGGRYAYIDALPQLKTVIELLEKTDG